MNNQLEVQKEGVFTSIKAFESAQQMATAMSKSAIIPKAFQKKPEDIMIALELANRTGTSVIMVMQNIDIIQGKPSWSSKYVISALNSCGRFSPLRFKYEDLGKKTINYVIYTGYHPNKKKFDKSIEIHDMKCTAFCKDLEGEVIEGPAITISMAVKEGWYTKDGSKWPTMTKLMMSYRSAKFFGNLYAPDVLMGMQSADEVIDISPVDNSNLKSDEEINANQKFKNEDVDYAEVIE